MTNSEQRMVIIIIRSISRPCPPKIRKSKNGLRKTGFHRDRGPWRCAIQEMHSRWWWWCGEQTSGFSSSILHLYTIQALKLVIFLQKLRRNSGFKNLNSDHYRSFLFWQNFDSIFKEIWVQKHKFATKIQDSAKFRVKNFDFQLTFDFWWNFVVILFFSKCRSLDREFQLLT